MTCSTLTKNFRVKALTFTSISKQIIIIMIIIIIIITGKRL